MHIGNPQRSSDLRIHNQRIILSCIYEGRKTGLKAPTIFRIFSYLEEMNLIGVLKGSTLESGHIPVDSSGPPCTCGTNGCLESHIQALDKAGSLFSGLEERLAAGDNSAKVIAAKLLTALRKSGGRHVSGTI
jgi:hypothetical protein